MRHKAATCPSICSSWFARLEKEVSDTASVSLSTGEGKRNRERDQGDDIPAMAKGAPNPTAFMRREREKRKMCVSDIYTQ